MRKNTNQHFSKYRKSHHLKLKDLAYILDIDSGNLSRFESGKTSSKAMLGYHILFNLSTDYLIGQVLVGGYSELTHRCFQLLEILNNQAQTSKIKLRQEGIDRLIKRLTDLEESYAAQQ
jgi:transcriptional regulator with XRE-family HTH domain